MKHFTPELLSRFRSKDEKVAETAAEEWESQGQAYNEYLQSIQPQLPVAFRDLLKSCYLHDARVIFAGQHDREFCITLGLDTPPHDVLMLRYELIGDPVTVRHDEISTGDSPVEWLYDEVEVGTNQAGPIFRHSILLSNGLELQIGFRDFTFDHLPSQQVVVGGCLSAVSQSA